MFVALELAYLLLPPACWAFLVRTRIVGAAVFAVLAGLALALVGLEKDWYFTRATAEIETGYPVAAGLALLAGALAEQRLRGPRTGKDYDHPVAGSAVAVTAHVLVGAGIAFAYQLLAHDAFVPSRAELSLPPGLTATAVTGGSCGSDFCSRTLTIGSDTGLPADEVEARLRAALAADGWTPGRDGALVRPHGWLVDGRVSQVHVTGRTVELSGSELADRGP